MNNSYYTFRVSFKDRTCFCLPTLKKHTYIYHLYEDKGCEKYLFSFMAVQYLVPYLVPYTLKEFKMKMLLDEKLI